MNKQNHYRLKAIILFVLLAHSNPVIIRYDQYSSPFGRHRITFTHMCGLDGCIRE